jgi:hypothetical protein
MADVDFLFLVNTDGPPEPRPIDDSPVYANAGNYSCYIVTRDLHETINC